MSESVTHPHPEPFGGLSASSSFHGTADDLDLDLVGRCLDNSPGFALLRGIVPCDESVPGPDVEFLTLCRQFGFPLWQDALGTLVKTVAPQDNGQLLNEEAGVVDLTTAARSSETSEALPFHTDGAAGWFGQDVDVAALLCVRDEPDAGDTLLLDARAAFNCLYREHPAAAATLCLPVPFHRPSGQLAEQSLAVQLPMFTWDRSVFRARLNIARVRASAVHLEWEGPALFAALDRLEEIINRPELRIRLHLEPGDCLLTDDRRIAHSRTRFSSTDRRLLRVWLQRPSPNEWSWTQRFDMT